MSHRWLSLSQVLWSLIFGHRSEGNSSVADSTDAILSFLDLLQWRRDARVTAQEFTTLYVEWTKMGSSSVNISRFRQLLHERRYQETHLDIFVALLLHESRIHILQSTTLDIAWMTMTEEIFFTCDAKGLGRWGWDEIYFFAACLIVLDTKSQVHESGNISISNHENNDGNMNLSPVMITAIASQLIRDITGQSINLHTTMGSTTIPSNHKSNRDVCVITVPQLQRYFLARELSCAKLSALSTHIQRCIDVLARVLHGDGRTDVSVKKDNDVFKELLHACLLSDIPMTTDGSGIGYRDVPTTGEGLSVGLPCLWRKGVLSAAAAAAAATVVGEEGVGGDNVSAHVHPSKPYRRQNQVQEPYPAIVLYLLTEFEAYLSVILLAYPYDLPSQRSIHTPLSTTSSPQKHPIENNGNLHGSSYPGGVVSSSSSSRWLVDEEVHQVVKNLWHDCQSWDNMNELGNTLTESTTTTTTTTTSSGGRGGGVRIGISTQHIDPAMALKLHQLNDRLDMQQQRDSPDYHLIFAAIMTYKRLQQHLSIALIQMRNYVVNISSMDRYAIDACKALLPSVKNTHAVTHSIEKLLCQQHTVLVRQITSPRQSPTKNRLTHTRSLSSSTHPLQSSFPWLTDENINDDNRAVQNNNGQSGGGIGCIDVVDDDYRRTLLVRQLLDTNNVADQMAIITELSRLATTTTTTGASHTNPTTISAPTTAIVRSHKTTDTPSHHSQDTGPRPHHGPSLLTNTHHHRPHTHSAASSHSSPSSHSRPTSSSPSGTGAKATHVHVHLHVPPNHTTTATNNGGKYIDHRTNSDSNTSQPGHAIVPNQHYPNPPPPAIATSSSQSSSSPSSSAPASAALIPPLSSSLHVPPAVASSLANPSSINTSIDSGHSLTEMLRSGQLEQSKVAKYAETLKEILRQMPTSNDAKDQLKSLQKVLKMGYEIAKKERSDQDQMLSQQLLKAQWKLSQERDTLMLTHPLDLELENEMTLGNEGSQLDQQHQHEHVQQQYQPQQQQQEPQPTPRLNLLTKQPGGGHSTSAGLGSESEAVDQDLTMRIVPPSCTTANTTTTTTTATVNTAVGRRSHRVNIGTTKALSSGTATVQGLGPEPVSPFRRARTRLHEDNNNSNSTSNNSSITALLRTSSGSGGSLGDGRGRSAPSPVYLEDLQPHRSSSPALTSHRTLTGETYTPDRRLSNSTLNHIDSHVTQMVSTAPDPGLGRRGVRSPLLATRQHLAYTPSSQQQRGYISACTPNSTPSYNNQTLTRAASGSRPGPLSSPFVPGTYSSNYHYQKQPLATINTINSNKGVRKIPGTSTPIGPQSHGNGGGRGSGTRKVFGHPL